MGRPRKYFTEEERKEAKRKTNAKWVSKNPTYFKDYDIVNKDKRKESKKQYYETNKAQILDKMKQYQEAHKDKYAEYKKKWFDKNPEYRKEWLKKWRETLYGACHVKVMNYKRNDKNNFGTDETTLNTKQMQEMIETQPQCFYCGCEDLMKLGLDRIDNDKPHTVDNCVVACWDCNIERQKMDFFEFCKKKGVE